MKFFLLILCFFLFFACTEDNIQYSNHAAKLDINKKVEITPKVIKKLSNLFINKILTRSSETSIDSLYGFNGIESITPIELNDSKQSNINDTELYIVNYKNNNGYLIISTNENNFPIISFNSQGNINFNEEDSLTKAVIREQYENYLRENVGDNINIWSDIVDCLNNPEINDDGLPINSIDSTCITTIEFLTAEDLQTEDLAQDDESIPDTKTVLYEDVPHEFFQTRSIPERKYPIGRLAVFPQIQYTNLRWHSGLPYNLEMPSIYLPSLPLLYGDQAQVPSITLALSKIMYFHRSPFYYDWKNIPTNVTKNEKSSVSNLLRIVSEKIGAEKIYPNSYGIKGNKILELASVLESDFGFTFGGKYFKFLNDENTFKQVYGSLTRYHPVLFFKGNISSGYIGDSWIVDGYQELCVKVIKKWFFCGICYKKRTYYYYRDYFHQISSKFTYYKKRGNCYDDYYDGWYRYDHKIIIDKTYAVIDICTD